MTPGTTRADAKASVIILTGFLGSGKTTLLNRILTAEHGRRVAVIVNEFGGVGIDHHLLLASDQEVVQMNNGCVCCTVRGDLVRSFFHTLGEVEPLPQIIIFYNSGVKLACEGSRVIDDLCTLAEQGIEMLVCGTCLGYYEMTGKLIVGEVSNMYDIAEAMLGAGKVVNL